ncbi:hypothetical protein [Aquitalea sp. ASV15]|uniref:hypothetical protein n=1 Tax=Aquitalea sp. ASV15 TaxID=2795104 RepID=UPI0018EA87E1|nr:hypothetical protein [Aquitalea sp. ASV15]
MPDFPVGWQMNGQVQFYLASLALAASTDRVNLPRQRPGITGLGFREGFRLCRHRGDNQQQRQENPVPGPLQLLVEYSPIANWAILPSRPHHAHTLCTQYEKVKNVSRRANFLQPAISVIWHSIP